MNNTTENFVAGHRGMVGSAIMRNLQTQGQTNIITYTHTHLQLDLANQTAVQEFFQQEKSAQVYLAAAKVGGSNRVYLLFTRFPIG